jgi:hypothetical protein
MIYSVHRILKTKWFQIKHTPIVLQSNAHHQYYNQIQYIVIQSNTIHCNTTAKQERKTNWCK